MRTTIHFAVVAAVFGLIWPVFSHSAPAYDGFGRDATASVVSCNACTSVRACGLFRYWYCLKANQNHSDQRLLDISNQDVERLVITRYSSPYRYGPTQVQYLFHEQKAVLIVYINNEQHPFQIKGSLFVFDMETTREALLQWSNNQYSDGIYENAAVPKDFASVDADIAIVSTAEDGAIITGDYLGESYQPYKVEYAVGNVSIDNSVSLAGFADTVPVYDRIETDAASWRDGR